VGQEAEQRHDHRRVAGDAVLAVDLLGQLRPGPLAVLAVRQVGVAAELGVSPVVGVPVRSAATNRAPPRYKVKGVTDMRAWRTGTSHGSWASSLLLKKHHRVGTAGDGCHGPHFADHR
jgi:hypothetical protein